MSDFRIRISVILLPLLLFLVLRFLIFDIFTVRASSMSPELPPGTIILVNRAAYGLRWPFSSNLLCRYAKPAVGDIVVFQLSNEALLMLKRVIATGGDTLALRKGNIIVNKQPLRVPIHNLLFLSRHTVKSNHIFVLGDKISHSLDSRHFGDVPLTNIIGRAALVLLPLDKAGGIN